MSYLEESLTPECEIDVIIIGGGPAGLSCALLLGRCKRQVLVFDEGRPRNKNASRMNGFISRDGFNPLEFLSIARKELLNYGVLVFKKVITKAEKHGNLFHVYSEEGKLYICKKLVLATGIVDILPDIPGIDDYFGVSVFHCPYCDGWENQKKRIGVLGDVNGGAALAMNLKTWSDNVFILKNGSDSIPDKELNRLKKMNVPIYPERIKNLQGSNAQLKKILFDDGTSIDCDALFVSFGYKQHSDIAKQLMCDFTKHGSVKTNKLQETNIHGFYVVGDASRDMQLVIVAASEGTKAGVAIHTALMLKK